MREVLLPLECAELRSSMIVTARRRSFLFFCFVAFNELPVVAVMSIGTNTFFPENDELAVSRKSTLIRRCMYVCVCVLS